MILRSSSGYCMPFEEPIKQDVQMSLGYGEQKNPVTGETFFHHGIDFSVNHYLLSAVATGTVSAIGSDAEHGIYQTIRYGKYEVTYRHLSNVFANFSQSVKAGQTIAISGDLLHMEVRFDGEEINPLEFLTMLYGNIKALEHNSQMGITGHEHPFTLRHRPSGDRGIDAPLPSLLLRGPSTRSILSARTYGAVVEKHLLVGSEQALFLRDHAEHG